MQQRWLEVQTRPCSWRPEKTNTRTHTHTHTHTHVRGHTHARGHRGGLSATPVGFTVAVDRSSADKKTKGPEDTDNSLKLSLNNVE